MLFYLCNSKFTSINQAFITSGSTTRINYVLQINNRLLLLFFPSIIIIIVFKNDIYKFESLYNYIISIKNNKKI